MPDGERLDHLIYAPRIKKLQKTLKILNKLFFKEKFLDCDFGLTSIEQSLVRAIVIKKFSPPFSVEFNKKCFNKIIRINLIKQNEDGVKFIYKKAIRQLKNNFKSSILTKSQQKTLSKREIKSRFYMHFFEAHLEDLGIDLEKINKIDLPKLFFEKAITLKFLRKLVVNQDFIKRLTLYFKQNFLIHFKNLNKIKIKKLIIKWESLFEKMIKKKALETIISQIYARGNKIPWTICEVQNSLSYMIKFFESLQPII